MGSRLLVPLIAFAAFAAVSCSIVTLPSISLATSAPPPAPAPIPVPNPTADPAADPTLTPAPIPPSTSAPSIESSNASHLNSTLQLVHVIFRHGPRTPVNTYPNDPHLNETFFPYGWGHLTNAAKRELFNMGKWLRKRYRKILGPYYKNDVLHAQSTASPRTLMSMATVLASMFPPKKTAMEWNDRYNWQPVPVFSDPPETDITLKMTAECPRYNEAFQEMLQLPHIVKELEGQQQLFKNLSEITGLNVTKANDITSIYITLLAEKEYGLDLPPWTEHYFPEKMQFMAEQNYVYNAYTPEMRKIKGGPFIQKMFREMQEMTAGTLQPSERKMFMYCAHDWSITNILAALGVWERQMPRFSAMAAFELHQNANTGEYYVEIYFRNDPNQNPVKLTVPGCDFQCPLTKLMELSAAVLPDATYEEMCRSRNA